jgi:hypothetical protein
MKVHQAVVSYNRAARSRKYAKRLIRLRVAGSKVRFGS